MTQQPPGSSYESHKEIERLLKENSSLLAENNRLVKKIYRLTIAGIWFRVFWYALLIGIPFLLYFYVLQPYFEAFGGSFETFIEGINQLPGIKSIEIFLNRGE